MTLGMLVHEFKDRASMYQSTKKNAMHFPSEVKFSSRFRTQSCQNAKYTDFLYSVRAKKACAVTPPRAGKRISGPRLLAFWRCSGIHWCSRCHCSPAPGHRTVRGCIRTDCTMCQHNLMATSWKPTSAVPTLPASYAAQTGVGRPPTCRFSLIHKTRLRRNSSRSHRPATPNARSRLCAA